MRTGRVGDETNAKVSWSTTDPKARFRPQEGSQMLYTLLGVAQISRLAPQHGCPGRVEEVVARLVGTKAPFNCSPSSQVHFIE